MFIAFLVRGAVGKRFTAAGYSTPGKGRLLSGYMGTEYRLMNVLEWGFNYEILPGKTAIR